jgi:hypothetical protein
MRLFRSLSVLAFTIVVLCGASRAYAQSVDSVGQTERTVTTGDVPAHPDNVGLNGINFEDCARDVQLTHVISHTRSQSYPLEEWVGTGDCTDPTTRQNTGTPTCWRLKVIGSDQPTPVKVTTSVRDILSRLDTTDVTSDKKGTEAACNQRVATGAIPIKLFFFYRNGDKPAGTTQVVEMKVDTRAPAVPGGKITIGIGSSILFAKISGDIDPDTKNWYAYCDPPPKASDRPDPASLVCTVPSSATTKSVSLPMPALPDGAPDDATDGDAGPTDAAAATDATVVPEAGVTDSGSGTTTDAGNGCTSSNTGTENGLCGRSFLVAGGGTTTSTGDEAGTTTSTGTQAVINPVFKCGQSDVLTNKIQIDGLTDNVHYSIAVAAVDGYGNIGPLSNVECAMPEPISDFWNEYKDAGGKAGGSFCALEAAGLPAETAVFGFSIVGAALVLAKRRRRS